MKPSFYNFLVPSFFGGSMLAYNALSGSFLALNAEESCEAQTLLDARAREYPPSCPDSPLYQKLVNGCFLIEEGVDEARIVRQRYYEGRRRTSGLALTIAPTINCNFGCHYCFQEHPNTRMTAENVRAIEQYTERRLETGTSLHVTWFGGEPLLAFDVIVGLCGAFGRLCKERDCRFSQSMITNGSLLDEPKIEFLAGQGNFTFIQITLDGPPAVHDRRRTARGGQGTFEKILANVERAADCLPITIRVNIDRTNYRDLPGLVDLLVERGLRNRLSIYLGHVLPYTEVCRDVDATALSREEFAQMESEFSFYLLQRGFIQQRPLPKPRGGGICTVDHPGGAVLAPGNLMFRCWNEVAMSPSAASGFLGDAPPAAGPFQILANNAGDWDAYDPFGHEMCRTCKVQPLCKGGCPWEARKNPSESTGHCTTLKFNLADELRSYHLRQTIAQCLHEETRAAEVPVCA